MLLLEKPNKHLVKYTTGEKKKYCLGKKNGMRQKVCLTSISHLKNKMSVKKYIHKN